MQKLDLIAVMPAYNEEETIRAVVTEWMRAFDQEEMTFCLFAVNDGSTDNTLSILQRLEQEFPERLLLLDKPNSGHGRSSRFGYLAALQHDVPWIFQFDADGQCDPSFFSSFWAKRNQADCIFGIRVTRDDGWIRRFITAACRFFTALVTGRDLKDANVPYRLMERSALEKALALIPEDFDLQNVALSLALKRNPALRWQYIPIGFRARKGGVNSRGLVKLVKVGFQMLLRINRIGR
jgi:dolichol-phosphate mannosyltransferase